MVKKITAIFLRDMKVSLRDFIALYIIAFPLIFAVVINLFVPGINEATVSIAMLSGDDSAHIDYYRDYAQVEVFETPGEVTRRVAQRDNLVGILPENNDYYILVQGNEPEGLVDYVKTLRAYEYFGVSSADTSVEFVDFGRTIPPMKKLFVNVAIMLGSVLGGMLIALNIVEEKVDNTISAINVSPVSRIGFIIGKSIIGILVPVVGIVIMLIVTGFADVNLIQILMMLLASSIISILVGFIEGINNDDVINAAGNIKILFLPLMGSVAAAEMLADKWQKFFYWIPFYWTYKANDMILSKSGTWGEILIYTAIVIAISALVFAALAPKIRKGLEG
ncbi:MAG: ABC transporter substrate-binding protein [delta proteobacterium ML8_F1]|nr:MAG: ABC transporter substrate-binding protein [delta proteobacterium ML8_F1]